MSTSTTNPSTPFITGTELYHHFQHGQRMTIIDSHWAKTENSAWEAYVTQHIPGAMFCNPLRHLAGIPSRQHGRNPIPDVNDLQRYLDDWGVMTDRPTYIYDTGANLYAARAWWILRWAGVNNVSILNGGTGEWQAAGGDVAGGIGALRGRGDVTVTPGSMPTLEIDEIEDWLAQGKMLVDNRDEARFKGLKENVDHQAGHIPGAVNIPTDVLQESNGRVLPAERVRKILGELGVEENTEIAVYSGSGVHSSLFIAAMEAAGLPAPRHYVGGWSQWSSDAKRPIERG
ncbi:sulfurtransferase [Corynebacterium sp. 320]|uniref:sulfurtransferase n=1 Tax=Corynebacterium TaxID=1716 RepID=UPI00125CAA26|nr:MULTISPECIES: rhodanese-like domain-containing protein [Corynebacterium]KAB1503121.1 sulfurtransferase [Corynebacterium sp. 320]KAB1550665.1 sulfurtransferase [Corynebacterium sp. 321]KAB1551027.1 sulfurtransferase [Corynebacterium sp. 319]KAB3526918.1 sulfurtransferase [Corynebacterium sp. 250]KAB3538411.1 sulfurtransferase [Corynebacterium sp. 366]